MKKSFIAAAVGSVAVATLAAIPAAQAATTTAEVVAKNAERPSISDGGGAVEYLQPSGTTFNVMRWSAGTSRLVVQGQDKTAVEADMSGDGQSIATALSPWDGSPTLQETNVWSGKTTTLDLPAPASTDTGFTKIGKPSVSDDGTRVAFAGTANGKSNAYVWHIDDNGQGLTRITSGDGVDHVVISGNGKKVAYSTGGHAYVRDALGEQDRQPVDVNANGTTWGGQAVPIAFSDSGTYVLFNSTTPHWSVCPEKGDNSSVIGCAFRRDLSDYHMTKASVLNGQLAGTDGYADADLSGDGRVAVFIAPIVTGTGGSYTVATYRFATKKSTVQGHDFSTLSLDKDGSTLAYEQTHYGSGEWVARKDTGA